MACALVIAELCIALTIVLVFIVWHRRGGDPLDAKQLEGFEQNGFTGIDYERLYAVATAFRRILERPPSEEELQKYQNKLSLDPEFDVPALETHLRQSAEYKRLVGLQKNSTLAEIGGVVSEQAIRGKLVDIYTRITGQKPDGVTMDLLYSRYRHTNLSDAYITALIQQMAKKPKDGKDGMEGPNASNDSTLKTGREDSSSQNARAGAGDVAGSITVEREWLKSLGMTEEDLSGTPSQVMDRLRAIAQKSCTPESDAAKDGARRKAICSRDRQRMLDSIGYDEGKIIGSWTLPQNRNDKKYLLARQDHRKLLASNDQTSLVGTMLADIKGNNMTLTDLPSNRSPQSACKA